MTKSCTIVEREMHFECTTCYATKIVDTFDDRLVQTERLIYCTRICENQQINIVNICIIVFYYVICGAKKKITYLKEVSENNSATK